MDRALTIISTAMALLSIGCAVWSVIMARKASAYAREALTMSKLRHDASQAASQIAQQSRAQVDEDMRALYRMFSDEPMFPVSKH